MTFHKTLCNSQGIEFIKRLLPPPQSEIQNFTTEGKNTFFLGFNWESIPPLPLLPPRDEVLLDQTELKLDT